MPKSPASGKRSQPLGNRAKDINPCLSRPRTGAWRGSRGSRPWEAATYQGRAWAGSCFSGIFPQNLTDALNLTRRMQGARPCGGSVPSRPRLLHIFKLALYQNYCIINYRRLIQVQHQPSPVDSSASAIRINISFNLDLVEQASWLGAY